MLPLRLLNGVPPARGFLKCFYSFKWGPGGNSLGGGNPVRATTLTSESERQSGRLGVWLYSSHTRARVARGVEEKRLRERTCVV